jgi:hypothetical protein
MRLSEHNSVGTEIGLTNFSITPSASFQRVSGTRLFTEANAAHARFGILGGVPNGNTVDLTLRIAAPQLEQNTTASEYIPTTGSAKYDQPRFDHDPVTGESLGLLIEEQRVNSVKNSQAIGTINGVIWNNTAFVGSGTIPLWGSFVAFGSMEVVGSGTELGMRYVDVRISGTNNTAFNAAQIVAFNAFSDRVASSGQTWTSSAYVRLVGGSLTNVLSVDLTTQGRLANQDLTENAVTTFTPSSTYQRVATTKAMTNALTARVSPDLTVVVAPSNTVDLTLRIAAPQLEQGAFATSYIPTTGSTATRNADNATVSPISSFFNASEGTLFADYRTGIVPVVGAIFEAEYDVPNRVGLFMAGVQVAINATYTSFATFTPSPFTNYKSILGYRAMNHAGAVNGILATNTEVGVPSNINLIRIGSEHPSSAHMCGHIRKVAYYPKRLPNATLQALTT